MKKYKLVKFIDPPEGYEDQYPFDVNETVVFLGEIEQMPGHCVVAKRNGQVLWGYHTENFVELTEYEV